MVRGLARNRVRNHLDGTIDELTWREVACPVRRFLSIDEDDNVTIEPEHFGSRPGLSGQYT